MILSLSASIKLLTLESKYTCTYNSRGMYFSSSSVSTDDEKIYNFLSEEIMYYMKNFEILATDAFKKKEIRHPKISNIGIKIENNLLKINLSEFNFSPSELAEIMEKYKLRKKYYKLTDGSFNGVAYDTIKEFIEYYFNGHI